MIEITHVTELDDPRDNGYYWNETDSPSDLFGPFSSPRRALHAADYDIADELSLHYFDANTRDFKIMRMHQHLSRFATAEVDQLRRIALGLASSPLGVCSHGATIRGLIRCDRRCRCCISIQLVENPKSAVLPTIAFSCIECGSFNVRIRHQAPLDSGASRWYHPNKGSDAFSVNSDQDQLDSACRDCNGSHWQSIKEGGKGWDDFRRWFAEQLT